MAIDDLEQLAEAGVKVLGSSPDIGKRHYRPGDMVFFGGLIGALAVRFGHVNYGWVVAAMLAIGWALNELEKRSPN